MERWSDNSFRINGGLVGAARFELATPCAQGRCATRLRYAPTGETLLILDYFRPGHPFQKPLSAIKTYQNRIKTILIAP